MVVQLQKLVVGTYLENPCGRRCLKAEFFDFFFQKTGLQILTVVRISEKQVGPSTYLLGRLQSRVFFSFTSFYGQILKVFWLSLMRRHL